MGLSSAISAADDLRKFSVKTLLAILALVVFFSSAYLTAQPLLKIPQNQAHHDSTTRDLIISTDQMSNAINRQLCIQVADHRKLDWQLCYTNPDQIIPQAIKTNGTY